ncbi:MAG: NmrA/HSCARG family protein [Myxococcaceae bacterium]
MSEEKKLIAVAGSTGRQGSAAVKHLLARGFRVRALTRNPGSPAARRLAALGAEPVKADPSEAASVRAALTGAYGVYSVQNFWDAGVESEIHQAKTIGEAAFGAGVKHFVQGSVGSAAKGSGVEHFESKFVIEEHLRALGLPVTFVRPSCFMENYYIPQVEIALLKGQLLDPVRAEKPFQLIATDDIGAFVAHVLATPSLIGQAIDIAGDQLTNVEAAQVFSRVMERPIVFKRIPPLVVRLFMSEMRPMFSFFDQKGFDADVAGLRTRFPEVKWQRLEDWLYAEGWDKRAKAVRKVA